MEDGSDVPADMGLHYESLEGAAKLIITTKDVKYEGKHKIFVQAEYDSNPVYRLMESYEI